MNILTFSDKEVQRILCSLYNTEDDKLVRSIIDKLDNKINLSNLINLACEDDDHTMVKYLCEHTNNLNDAILEVSYCGYPDCIMYLYENGAVINNEKIFERILSSGNLDMIKFLCNTVNVYDFNIDKISTQYCKIDTLKFLHENNYLNEHNMLYLFKEACKLGKVKCMIYLFENHCYDKETINDALLKATRHNSVGCLEYLCKNNIIDQEIIDEALYIACNFRQHDCVCYLSNSNYCNAESIKMTLNKISQKKSQSYCYLQQLYDNMS